MPKVAQFRIQIWKSYQMFQITSMREHYQMNFKFRKGNQ